VLIIKKVIIENYRLIKRADFRVNPDMNIFVGDNDSGKSTLLEVLSILTSGKRNGYAFDRQLKANLFNEEIRKEYIESIEDGSNGSPPKIILEAYCENSESNAKYKGTNNSQAENCPGIRIVVEFDEEYEEPYKEMINNGEIFDIPVEFYKVSYKYFSGEQVVFRNCPIKVAYIDTTRKDYSSLVPRFVIDNITEFLTQQEQIDLSTAYRNSRHAFRDNSIVKQLNQSIKENVNVGNRELAIDIKEGEVDEWKRQMSLTVDNIPFENIGFGSQNTIKVELAIKNSVAQMNAMLLEEPENNLSFSNMAKMIHRIVESREKQIFITTHSSYVANKLDLSKLLLVQNGEVFPFSDLDSGTINYFKKLPGYDTLRLVLAEKVILVEGATEELLIQRAYLDKYGKLPSADGIDVIAVGSLAFKRYCNIALLMRKPISIVTDNDGNVQENIINKYEGYLGNELLSFFYETDERLHTIEPSIVSVNLVDGALTESFLKAISRNGSMLRKNTEEVLNFMKTNKVEWALRVFDSEEKIEYPEHIKNAIKQYH